MIGCRICNGLLVEGDKEEYLNCTICGSMISFSKGNQFVGGDAPKHRELADMGRVARFKYLGCKSLYDFGCGFGHLIAQAEKEGMTAGGEEINNTLYDNFERLEPMVLSAIEVIEHLDSDGLNDFANAIAKQQPKFVYVETTFIDDCRERFDYGYCNLDIGHITIWSYKALDYFMDKIGYRPHTIFNKNSRTYEKNIVAGVA